MICCDVQIGVCPRCRQDAIVHLERQDAHQTGFGCLTCKTAEEKDGKFYQIKYE